MARYSRSEWGARSPRGETSLPWKNIEGLAIHYSGSQVDLDGTAARVRGIQNYHMNSNGWNDIAYNWLVNADGDIYEGRGWGVRSAAQGSNYGNGAYYAICFLGNDRAGRDDVTDKGRKAIATLIKEAESKSGRKMRVRPHSDFNQTACPGDELRNYIALEGWQAESWPIPLPTWFWRWNAWRLGEGTFKEYGPRNSRVRYRTGAPRLIPPWAWARAVAFDRARRK